MPWTFAHPAAVLPVYLLSRRKSHLLALCIGSLAPDLFYYAGAFQFASAAHTWRGFLMYCLPLGALVYLLVCRLWPMLHWFSPALIRARLRPQIDVLIENRYKHYGLVLASLAVGSMTHVAWDGFTHFHGWASDYFPLLNTPVVLRLPLYKLLQHASSVFGVLFICWYAYSEFRPARYSTDLSHHDLGLEQRRLVWYGWVVLLSLLSGIVVSAVLVPHNLLGISPERVLFYLILILTTLTTFVLTIAAFFFQRRYPPTLASNLPA